MSYRAIRGAITVENDIREEILQATETLLYEIIRTNQLERENIISILFSATKDITQVYPAVAARKLGIVDAGLLCFQEMHVESSLEKCIRVMLHVEHTWPQAQMKHIYLGKASTLRPDITEKKYSIAIDGPCGSGKSTVAKYLADELGFIYVDTGAMYRAVGLYCIQNNIPLSDSVAIGNGVEAIQIEIRYIKGEQHIFLQGRDVTQALRTQSVAESASKVALIQKVRRKLVAIQQEIAEQYNVIMDGRDIGTDVLPQATLKIYLNADTKIRTRRRIHELASKGLATDFDTIYREIKERDYRDMHRSESPLQQAPDAVFLDATQMNIEETANHILNLLSERIPLERHKYQ